MKKYFYKNRKNCRIMIFYLKHLTYLFYYRNILFFSVYSYVYFEVIQCVTQEEIFQS